MNLYEFQNFIAVIQKKWPCEKCKKTLQTPDIKLVKVACTKVLFEGQCEACKHKSLIEGTLKNPEPCCCCAAYDAEEKTKKQESRQHRKLKKQQKEENVKTISTDDILDMHNFLKGFKGNFDEVFPKKS